MNCHSALIKILVASGHYHLDCTNSALDPFLILVSVTALMMGGGRSLPQSNNLGLLLAANFDEYGGPQHSKRRVGASR